MVERAKSYFFEDEECSQPGIELVTELHFQYDQEMNSNVHKPLTTIHIQNSDDFYFISACKKQKHLYCSTFKNHKFIDFSPFDPIEISYQNIVIRIGMIDKLQYFFTTKRFNLNDIQQIRKNLQKLTSGEESPSNWPEWAKKPEIWKQKGASKSTRIVIVNEEIDQTNAVVIDTNASPPEPSENNHRHRGRRHDATQSGPPQSQLDLICKTEGCNKPTSEDQSHCSLECFRKHKKFSKFGHCLVESCNEPRTQNSQYCSPDCRQNHEDCNNSESIE
tara:strand:+ start:34 stop:861 length:828 start_codon:yes stop_codon:yes gene_type:complete